MSLSVETTLAFNHKGLFLLTTRGYSYFRRPRKTLGRRKPHANGTVDQHSICGRGGKPYSYTPRDWLRLYVDGALVNGFSFQIRQSFTCTRVDEHHIKDEESKVFKSAKKAFKKSKIEEVMKNFDKEKEKNKKNLK